MTNNSEELAAYINKHMALSLELEACKSQSIHSYTFRVKTWAFNRKIIHENIN